MAAADSGGGIGPDAPNPTGTVTRLAPSTDNFHNQPSPRGRKRFEMNENNKTIASAYWLTDGSGGVGSSENGACVNAIDGAQVTVRQNEDGDYEVEDTSNGFAVYESLAEAIRSAAGSVEFFEDCCRDAEQDTEAAFWARERARLLDLAAKA